ncbi:CinA family protein [Specibacter sp. RAF43]|uniref:CinA family protein n=1 Tax=Specibacter sp. RAF43 TaxID=3233057 RepID=UPI003F9EB14D
MIQPAGMDTELKALAAAIGAKARHLGCQVAVAESLTCGNIARHLGAVEASSEWFAGGVIAYTPATKFKVLGVDPGPVVSADCAEQMVSGVAELTDAQLAVAVTGVGGPGSQEGHPAGTVFIAGLSRQESKVAEFLFSGDTAAVLAQTVRAALALLDQLAAEELAVVAERASDC